ncbi:hypothetical protein MHU86_18280 [Fragilaria crotonensis]|nr:hypothetical protein MHU86_18280 [Fragilaria crotonensis]
MLASPRRRLPDTTSVTNADAPRGVGYSEDTTRLCDVQPGFGASATCNMMWSLRNPSWMPEVLEYDVRHAHPLGMCNGKAPSLPQDKVPKQNVMSKFGNGGRGCTGDPKQDYEHVLGWVKGFRMVVGGRKGKKEDLLYPWQVTLQVLKTWKRLVVPCEHLQLYFQVMMGHVVGAYETVVVGFHAFSRETQHYYVARASTRHGEALPYWTDDDRRQLMARVPSNAGASIDVHLEYETLHDVGSGYVNHSTGDVGVLETLTMIQAVSFDHLTLQPAMLLSCSYAYVFDDPDFAELLRTLLKKFLRPEVELEVVRAKQPGAMGGIRKAIPYVIRAKVPQPETTGLEGYESDGGDSSESRWTSDSSVFH